MGLERRGREDWIRVKMEGRLSQVRGGGVEKRGKILWPYPKIKGEEQNMITMRKERSTRKK